jgi:heme exporter protein D
VSAIVQWLQMGGYAAFVWPAYGVAAAVLGGLTIYCWRRHRASERELASLQPTAGATADSGR